MYTHAIARFSGEISLKSEPVRKRLMAALARSLHLQFERAGIPASAVIQTRARFVITMPGPDVAATCESILSRTPGIVSFSFCKPVPADAASIENGVLEVARRVIEPGATFAVRVTREGKHPFSSPSLAAALGAAVLQEFHDLGISVNLGAPDVTLLVEVRQGRAYVFHEKHPAGGGVPVDVSDPVIAVVGLIDVEWLATSMLARRGVSILPVLVTADEASDPVALVGKLTADESLTGRFHELATLLGSPDIPLVVAPLDPGLVAGARAVPSSHAMLACELLLGAMLAGSTSKERNGHAPFLPRIKGVAASCVASLQGPCIDLCGIARVLPVVASRVPGTEALPPPLLPVDVEGLLAGGGCQDASLAAGSPVGSPCIDAALVDRIAASASRVVEQAFTARFDAGTRAFTTR